MGLLMDADDPIYEAFVDITNVVARYNQQHGTDGAHSAISEIAEIIDRVMGDGNGEE